MAETVSTPAAPKEPDRPKEFEKPIGRRAFIGLVVAGLVALFVGKQIFPSLRGSGGQSGSGGVFRVNSVVHGPDFDPATWRLTVDGLFRKPLMLTWDQFLDMPQAEFTRDFYCVEGWGVTGVVWRGVSVREFMEKADIDPRATHLVFHSGDEVYTDSLTIEEALRPDSVLAREANSDPLPPDNGQPLRLVLPGSYGYKDVKWVVRVEAIAADDPSPDGYHGYWEQRGYPAAAEIR